jgi:hypothetical protein
LVSKRDLGKLNRLLFEAAFWNTNLAYFDGFRLASWPQREISTILWRLSVAANDWQKPDDLVRLCSTPAIGVLEAERDESGAIFEARILQALAWFDLLEVESTPDENWSCLERRRYRKSKTFDAFFRFAVTLEPLDMPVQQEPASPLTGSDDRPYVGLSRGPRGTGYRVSTSSQSPPSDRRGHASPKPSPSKHPQDGGVEHRRHCRRRRRACFRCGTIIRRSACPIYSGPAIRLSRDWQIA